MEIKLKKEGLEGENLKFVEGIESAINEAFKDLPKGLDEGKVKSILGGYDYTSIEEFRQLKKALEDQGLKIKEISEKGGVYKQKSLEEILKEKAVDLKAIKGKTAVSPLSFDLDVKAPATMLTTTNITPSPNPYIPAPTILGGLNRQRQTSQVIADYVSRGTISTPRVVWVNEVNGEGDAEFIAEGALKPLADFDITTEEESAKKVAVATKISEEMLEDISWMESEVRRFLQDKVIRKINEQILNGDGAGVNLNGILNRVGGYTQTCMNGRITSPGLLEVLAAAAAQIQSLYPGQLVAFVNSCDLSIARMRKDADGNVIDLTGVLENVTVVPTPEMPAGQFLIGDFNYFIFEVYKALRVEIGWENDDFRRNLRTLLAEARVLLRISSNNLGAFVHDTIANVQTLIAAPAV